MRKQTQNVLEDKITNKIAYIIATIVVIFIWFGIPYIVSTKEDNKTNKSIVLNKENKTDVLKEQAMWDKSVEQLMKEYNLEEKNAIELQKELRINKKIATLPWETTDSGKNFAECLDDDIKKTKEHLIYADNYIKTNNINESEKQEINEDIEFSKEFLRKVIYLRTFYNNDGSKKTDKEYFEYIAKSNHQSEIIKERLSEVNNIVKDFSVQLERGMALSDYIEIGTRRQSGRGNSTKEVLENNKKYMMDKVGNMVDEAENNDEKLKNWDR